MVRNCTNSEVLPTDVGLSDAVPGKDNRLIMIKTLSPLLPRTHLFSLDTILPDVALFDKSHDRYWFQNDFLRLQHRKL